MNQVDMARLADVMGVNLNESFYVRIGSYVYQCMMTLDGFRTFDAECFHWVKAPQIVGEIITNGYKMLKAPKVNELYYVPAIGVHSEYMYQEFIWDKDSADIERYNAGLVYKTKEEATAVAEKMLKNLSKKG